ncbi:uncharacterized protein LOC123547371 isoform X1 [Mercenaria mercenaria]|uniref:uncharacterized protein LOC123547371 isoform X1 n=2 Tax=Mercenaria mercenaria TaxID=6596 RepID=UPI00234F70CB|nr:uncharacterized protein LOC123547371 isoform X1 [Mercenaria mercenaria]
MKHPGFFILALVSVCVSGLETAPPGKDPGEYCHNHNCPSEQDLFRNMATKVQEKLKLVVFFGSTREGRLADRVKKFVLDHIQKKEKHDIVVYDPAEKEFPLLKKAFHYYDNKSEAPKLLQECDADIQTADEFLLISCEYNHSIPPALSNMLDHFPASSFAWRPSAILTYSPSQFGGMRAAMQLRAMTGELGCTSISKIFAIPSLYDVLNEDGTPKEGKKEHLVKELDELMSHLDWTAQAFKDKKTKSGVPSNL